MNVIQVSCDKQRLKMNETVLMTSGSQNYDAVQFTFTPDWDNFSRVAIFWRQQKQPYKVVLDVNNIAMIPSEILLSPGEMKFGVCGVDGDLVRVASTTLAYNIEEGAWREDAANSQPLTPSELEQVEAILRQVQTLQNELSADIEDAEDIIQEAEAAAQNATSAAQSANDASDRAQPLIEYMEDAVEQWPSMVDATNNAAPPIVESLTGEAVTATDSAAKPLQGLNIYGKTTQDGTPTPEAPIPLVNVGDDGSIDVYVTDGSDHSQLLHVATPNGLPGLPVAEGGNYTDADGQQWVCDEIDFARGVYVQRVNKIDLGSCTWAKDFLPNDQYRFTAHVNNMKWPVNAVTKGTVLCDSLEVITNASSYSGADGIAISHNSANVFVSDVIYDSLTAEEFKAAISGVMFLFEFIAPIETPLSSEQLAAYAALRSYKPNSTVYNNDGAWMHVRYIKDTKLYIDSAKESISGVDFTTDETLTLDPATKVLSVNCADSVEQDNTLPITSAAVYATVGSIETLLSTI